MDFYIRVLIFMLCALVYIAIAPFNPLVFLAVGIITLAIGSYTIYRICKREVNPKNEIEEIK